MSGHGSTIVDADGREYLDAAGGAIVVNVGHGRREIADAIAEQAGRLAYAHGSAFTTEPVERYAREVGPPPADDRPGDLPGLGRVGGHRDRAQAGPRDAARARRARPPGRVRPLGQLPRQHARRARPVRATAAAPARTRAGSGGSATSARRTRTAATSPARRRWARRRRWSTSWTRRSRWRGPGPWPRSSPSRSSGRRWAPSSRRDGLLAGHRRRLPPARRAAHRRRGHDRLRPDRRVVRA